MKITFPRGWIALAALAGLAGCAGPGPGGLGPAGFPDTRLQYAILTEDRDTLRRDFHLDPERTWTERAVAGLALPFAAATEAAFWPLYAGYSSDLSR